MKTYFITGNDTEIGKTYVSTRLIRHFLSLGQRVAYLKPVQCGADEDGATDVTRAQEMLGERGKAYNLFHFAEPVAPLTAAQKEGRSLGKATIMAAWRNLRPSLDAEVLLVEGAGGVAVPLDASGWDWADFAKEAQIQQVLLVVENRLGAINQARLSEHYLQRKGIVPYILLNDVSATPDQSVLVSNQESFALLFPDRWSVLSYRDDSLPRHLCDHFLALSKEAMTRA